LSNKDKVEKINFFGNKIQEVDLSQIFTEFSNLKYLNLDYNPLKVKNLSNLTSQQLEKLVEGMKNKKIRISASKGTVLADLLEYTQGLIKKGGGSSSSAHKLQAIIQNSPVKNSEQGSNKMGYPPWIISGVAVVSLALVVGYFVGKKRKIN
jgi:Leucine-rich repeat (LRR) protein